MLRKVSIVIGCLILSGCALELAAVQAAAITLCGVKPTVEQFDYVRDLIAQNKIAASVDRAADFVCRIATLSPALTGKAKMNGINVHWTVVDKKKFDEYRAAHGH